MKKTILKNIIKGILLEERGYSNYSDDGTTDGLTKGTLDKILLKISKGNEDEDQIVRGNKILDKADPENIARIIRGELPEYEEVDRMQELAGIQNEIKVNNPNKLQMDYEEDDDDGEVKIISLGKDGEYWVGHEDYTNDPKFLTMEFDIENRDEDEQDKMNKLISLLNKSNISYDITDDNEIAYVKIPKDKLDLKS